MTDISFLPTTSLRKWCRTSMCLELELVMVFCASCTAPSLSSNTGMHGIPTSGNIKRQTCLEKSTSLAMSPSATYSASVMESMTNFCVLENQLTHAPAHITNPPDTDLLSAALLAWSASAKACRFKGPRQPCHNPTCLFFIFLERKCIFRNSYTVFSIIVACETRLTANGISPEPNLCCCKLNILH